MEVASLIYDLRTWAGLSQRALARKVGTTASVICRLEDADYEGHSLAMLRRIAAALDKRGGDSFRPSHKAKAYEVAERREMAPGCRLLKSTGSSLAQAGRFLSFDSENFALTFSWRGDLMLHHVSRSQAVGHAASRASIESDR